MPLLQCNTSKPLLEEAAEIQDSGRKHKLSEFFGEFQLLNKRYHLTRIRVNDVYSRCRLKSLYASLTHSTWQGQNLSSVTALKRNSSLPYCSAIWRIYSS